jgi:hypothetical protein
MTMTMTGSLGRMGSSSIRRATMTRDGDGGELNLED